MDKSKQKLFVTVMTVLTEGSDDERKEFVQNNPKVIKFVIRLICRLIATDGKGELFDSLSCLAKISEVESGSILTALLEDPSVYEKILKLTSSFIHDNQASDLQNIELIKCCLVTLVNVTRHKNCCKICLSLLPDSTELIASFQAVLKNVIHISSMDNIDPVVVELVLDLIVNLSQSSLILDEVQKDKDNLALLMKDLIHFFESSTSPKIRGCCISIIINFLIAGSAQTTILDSKLELMPKLLYPLAGPTETEFDDEDMAKLPLDLQYLPPEKQREADNGVRDALISCLLLCCNTKHGRDCLKENGTYYILRELHKQEKERSIQKRIEDVVDILTKDEYEYNSFPDLMSTQIPDHLISKFFEMDQTLLDD